jgi:hypothetical protein
LRNNMPTQHMLCVGCGGREVALMMMAGSCCSTSSTASDVLKALALVDWSSRDPWGLEGVAVAHGWPPHCRHTNGGSQAAGDCSEVGQLWGQYSAEGCLGRGDKAVQL